MASLFVTMRGPASWDLEAGVPLEVEWGAVGVLGPSEGIEVDDVRTSGIHGPTQENTLQSRDS